MAGQLVDEYPQHTKRNGCIHCGAPRRPDEALYQFDMLVDELVDLDGNSRGGLFLVLCEMCAVEIGTLMGCQSPSAKKQADALIADLRQQLLGAETRIERVHAAARNLTNA